VVYLPPAFTERRREVLIAHIDAHDFGLLVTPGAAAPIASHIPFLTAQRGDRLYLQGHLARPNPQAADLADKGEALAIFTGPHAYVSPGWYAAGPAVPTWNYVDVHAYGPLTLIDDRGWLIDLLRRMVERHEAREPAPWRLDDLPRPYLDGMLNGIVGVELAVTRLEGKFKLSQNRPAEDRPRVIAALERRQEPESLALAGLMREREPTS